MMYIYYEVQTGRITQSAEMPLGNADGYGVITSDVNIPAVGNSHYVKDEAIVAYPTRPSTEFKFDFSLEQWVDTRLLADVKLARRTYINTERLTANQSYFTFQNKQIAVDTLSRSDIDGINGKVSLTGSLPIDWIGGWKTIDNSYVSIPDVATWVLFYTAMVDQGSTNFAQSQALKAQIDAIVDSATAIDEVEAIVW